LQLHLSLIVQRHNLLLRITRSLHESSTRLGVQNLLVVCMVHPQLNTPLNPRSNCIRSCRISFQKYKQHLIILGLVPATVWNFPFVKFLHDLDYTSIRLTRLDFTTVICLQSSSSEMMDGEWVVNIIVPNDLGIFFRAEPTTRAL